MPKILHACFFVLLGANAGLAFCCASLHSQVTELKKPIDLERERLEAAARVRHDFFYDSHGNLRPNTKSPATPDY